MALSSEFRFFFLPFAQYLSGGYQSRRRPPSTPPPREARPDSTPRIMTFSGQNSGYGWLSHFGMTL